MNAEFGSGGGNDGGENDVAEGSPVNAEAVKGRLNPRVSRACVDGGGPFGGAGAGGRDLFKPPVGGGGPVGPKFGDKFGELKLENCCPEKEMALGGGGGARSVVIRGPAKR